MECDVVASIRRRTEIFDIGCEVGELLDFFGGGCDDMLQNECFNVFLFPLFDAVGADNRCAVSGVLCRSGDLRN